MRRSTTWRSEHTERSTASAERSFFSLKFGRRRERGRELRDESRHDLVRETIPAYNLPWDDLKNYLEQKFPPHEFSETLTIMNDKYILYLPPPGLKDDQRQAINVMRNMQLQQTALIQGQEEGAEERQEAKGEQTKGSTHSV